MELSLALLLFGTVVLCKPFTPLYYVLEDNQSQPLNLSWADAWSECQALQTTLFTLDLVPFSTLRSMTQGLEMVWMGLQRDVQNDSVWLWVNTTIVEPTTGDISQSLNWAEGGASGHCAFYRSDFTWSSIRCDELQPFFCGSPQKNQYHKERLSWYEAWETCLREERQLFTILNKEDADIIKKYVQENMVEGWIGLHRLGGNTWEWGGGEALDYIDWAEGEPVTRDCGAWSVLEQSWRSFSCDSSLQTICHLETLLVVTQRKTWEEALEHCRGLGLQLLVLHNIREDYNYVWKRIQQADTDQVWVGLRFLAGNWWWVDGSPVEETLPLCPEPARACGVLSKSDTSTGLTADCSRRLNFVCYSQTGALVNEAQEFLLDGVTNV